MATIKKTGKKYQKGGKLGGNSYSDSLNLYNSTANLRNAISKYSEGKGDVDKDYNALTAAQKKNNPTNKIKPIGSESYNTTHGGGSYLVNGKINKYKKPVGSNTTSKQEKRSKQKNGGRTSKAKDGKWIQKATASIKRRGTEGKCTPITKPGCTGKAKALAKTFKKIAKQRKGK